eukprot:Gb_29821 [translate_table: standard]
MAVKVSKAEKKVAYDNKLCQLLEQYTQVLITAADNVGSNQLQGIRKGLRIDSVVLMGKNTMMKRSIRMHAEKTGNTAYLNLIPLLVGNVGLVFTKGDLKEVREEVAKYKVGKGSNLLGDCMTPLPSANSITSLLDAEAIRNVGTLLTETVEYRKTLLSSRRSSTRPVWSKVDLK